MTQDPRTAGARPPFETAPQSAPGAEGLMTVPADHGETSYEGTGKLSGQAAIITGGDSGIGRAVAIAFAREGADVLISYLDEHDDARATDEWVKRAGRRCILMPGDIGDPAHCVAIVERAVREFGRLDVLVNNAAYQKVNGSFDDVTAEAIERHYRTNVFAMLNLSREAAARMQPGASIINTTSVNSVNPPPGQLAYSSTKGAVNNLTAGLGQLLADRGIRVNAVAPGPIWTPLIPSTMAADQVAHFGAKTPLGRPGQPRELAGAYVFLASEAATYITGAIIPVTGGMPFL